jgi:hypothetical protein
MRAMDGRTVEVAIGYAGSPAGIGVAYAGIGAGGRRDVLRLPFRITGISPPVERAVAYAALVTVARALAKRGVRRARFVLPDAQLAQEMTTRCEVPAALVLPYVKLRCALNALDSFEIQNGPTDELTQRARAEVALNLAA